MKRILTFIQLVGFSLSQIFIPLICFFGGSSVFLRNLALGLLIASIIIKLIRQREQYFHGKAICLTQVLFVCPYVLTFILMLMLISLSPSQLDQLIPQIKQDANIIIYQFTSNVRVAITFFVLQVYSYSLIDLPILITDNYQQLVYMVSLIYWVITCNYGCRYMINTGIGQLINQFDYITQQTKTLIVLYLDSQNPGFFIYLLFIILGITISNIVSNTIKLSLKVQEQMGKINQRLKNRKQNKQENNQMPLIQT